MKRALLAVALLGVVAIAVMFVGRLGSTEDPSPSAKARTPSSQPPGSAQSAKKSGDEVARIGSLSQLEPEQIRLAEPGSDHDPLMPARKAMLDRWRSFLGEANLSESQERQLILALADLQREYQAFRKDWIQFATDSLEPDSEEAEDFDRFDAAAEMQLQDDMKAKLLERVHGFLSPTQVGLLKFHGLTDVPVVGGLGLFVIEG